MQDKTIQSIKEKAIQEVERIKKELNEAEAFLRILDKYSSDNTEVTTEIASSGVKHTSSKTLKLMIYEVLKDRDEPLSSKEVMDEIKFKFNKKYAFVRFSGQFSHLIKKLNNKFAKYEVESAPVSIKFYYGLRQWFNADGSLKTEYFEKLKKRDVLKEFI